MYIFPMFVDDYTVSSFYYGNSEYINPGIGGDAADHSCDRIKSYIRPHRSKKRKAETVGQCEVRRCRSEWWLWFILISAIISLLKLVCQFITFNINCAEVVKKWIVLANDNGIFCVKLGTAIERCI